MTKPKTHRQKREEETLESKRPPVSDQKLPQPKTSGLTERKLRDSQKELAHLQEIITETHGRELWLASKTAIAVVAALSINQRSNPLVVIFEGGSGRGKSFVINLLEPDRGATHERIVRLDSFTPKSFVSHAANRTKERLAEIDLLPKLQDKVLLVKELAPIFTGREDALRENFAILTAVLDGKGLVSASGTHGTRGYEGRYIFNWIGGTTPIPPSTDRIMSQLGNRMFRYEIAGANNSEKDLIAFAEGYAPKDIEDEYRKEANSFIAEHFKRFGVNSVQPTDIRFSKDQLEQLVRYANLLCIGRVGITVTRPPWASEYEYVAGIPEGPHRVILGLKLLAQALALISGRQEINEEDLEIVRHVAFSSIPQNRRLILRAMLVKGGQLTSKEAERELRISRVTARNHMKELAATGLADYQPGDSNKPDTITLSGQFSWLLGKKGSQKAESREVQDEAQGEAEPTGVFAESH